MHNIYKIKNISNYFIIKYKSGIQITLTTRVDSLFIGGSSEPIYDVSGQLIMVAPHRLTPRVVNNAGGLYILYKERERIKLEI